jgi:predicted flap endonuclease-1-like 5' DNA nuclease
MSYPLMSIDGVCHETAGKLKAQGVRTSAKLLERAKTPRGRKTLAAASGVEETRILRFANMADLMRLRGVGQEYAELLEAAGVDTVKELRNRNPANLTRAMAEANSRKPLVRLLPSEKLVTKWIAQAKTMPPMMTY